MRLDGVSTATAIGIASFAIDRIVTAVLSLLSMGRVIQDPDLVESPIARAAAGKRYKALYYFSSAALVIAFLWSYRDVGVLSVLGLTTTAAPGSPELPGRTAMDTLLTFIVLVGGADRVSAFLKGGKDLHAEKPAPQPLQVTGKLTLEEGNLKDHMKSQS